MGGTCSTRGRNEKCLVWVGSLMGRDHLEDLGVDGRIVLEWILGRMLWEVVDWMHPTQDRDQWQAVVYTVMNLRVP
jgi:hypothetical protein